jgi:coenzyme PQQ biosynthesis protein B
VKIHVLGSAAGGGFPQWNCNCPQCNAVRDGSPHHVARTQSSIAVTANETDWLLINASPDVLQQIKAFPALQPARALRDTGIAAVFERLITNFDIMFDNHAYTHWYENNGVSREMMAHARNTIVNLAQSYRDAS